MAQSSQKFIARNRPPRVQIEYDVELYGAEKLVQIPFVMGVLADLSGKPREDDKAIPVGDRKFLQFDAENFNERLKAMKPRLHSGSCSFGVRSIRIGHFTFTVSLSVCIAPDET